MNRTRIRSGLAVVAASSLLAVACGDDSAGSDGADREETASSGDGFPVTIENCGTETTYEAPPERAVAIHQHPTEIMLALGLADSMVGTAYMDSEVRDDLVDDYDAIPELAEEAPSREQVLAVDPDIVVGGWDSAFADDAAGSRDGLADVGVDTWLEVSSCEGYTDEPSLDVTRRDITELGAIFGVPDRAEELITEIEGPIDEVADRLDGVEPVDVFVYDSGTDQAFTTGGLENTTALIELAGGRNIFADLDETWTEVSWEDVVAGEPDVVMILNYGSETVGEKEEFLRSHPIASTLTAVEEDRLVVVDLTDVVPGVRNGDVVAEMAGGFHPDEAPGD